MEASGNKKKIPSSPRYSRFSSPNIGDIQHNCYRWPRAHQLHWTMMTAQRSYSVHTAEATLPSKPQPFRFLHCAAVTFFCESTAFVDCLWWHDNVLYEAETNILIAKAPNSQQKLETSRTKLFRDLSYHRRKMPSFSAFHFQHIRSLLILPIVQDISYTHIFT